MTANPEILKKSLEPKLLDELSESRIEKYENVRFEAKCEGAEPVYRTSSIFNGTLYLTNYRLVIIADSKY